MIQWQRYSPTDKRGRVHTSLISVVVIENKQVEKLELKESDLHWRYTKGTGAGGQNKNKLETKVVLTHVPTGIVVNVDGRKRGQNKEEALRVMTERLEAVDINDFHNEQNSTRNSQLGRRGTKIRTVRECDGIVVNHLSGRSIPVKHYYKGMLVKLR
jgi:peptide chain release factor 1